MSIATDVLLRQEHVENKRYLEVFFRQAAHLERLVSDLLDTTHIEAGHLDLNLSTHDLRILVQDAIELNRTGSELHYFNVELGEEAWSATVTADACRR
jgi:signal transduction histidine kinase